MSEAGVEGSYQRLKRTGELPFEPRSPVKWLDPRTLFRTAVQLMLSSIFERFADKRENLAGIDAPVLDLGTTTDDDLWIDYVSDIGDGFDATTTVAWVLAKDSLTIEGEDLPRGSVLVMGGDEVYPFASITEYENRTIGPYRAVFPHSDPPCPVALAIPGNHDWYDGLTAFLHIFAQKRADQTPGATTAGAAITGRWIGGWATAERRSYFAARLPGRWWLLGIDIQLDTYIDNPQMEYFTEVARQLQPGDGVILCCARPSWLHCGKSSPESYAVLDFFERTIITPTRAHLRLTLTGDHHSYGRYHAPDGEQKIIAGGGGAFLDATHHFPPTLVLPPEESRDRSKSPSRAYCLVADSLYPTIERSKAETWKFARVLWRNGLLFPLMVALIYGLWAWAIPDTSALSSVGFWATFALAVLMLAMLTHEETFLPKLIAVPHALAHLGAVYGLSRLFADLDLTPVYVGVAGAGVGPLLLGVYLLVGDRLFTINSSELFAGMRIERFKCFLRIKVSPTGEVTVYSIGVDPVVHRWKLLPSVKDKPSVAPADPAEVTTRFIDGPVVVTRTPTTEGELTVTVETTTDVIPVTTDDGMVVNLHHVTGERPPSRGPVVLVHGAGVRADIFRPPEQTTLVDMLIADGWDVWLENWRASIDLAPNPWTLDQAAVYDHPALVGRVVAETGADSVKAVIHCQGSTSFAMSAAAGLLPHVTTIVSNAVSLHPRVPGAASVKIQVATPIVERLTEYLNPRWGLEPSSMFAKLLVGLVRMTHRECDSNVCRMVSFTYGVGFPCLWSHDNLTDRTHSWIDGEFAEVPVTFFEQMAESIRRGHMVSVGDVAGLPRSFVAGPPQTDARFVLMAGQDNKCFLPDSQQATFEFLDGLRPGYHSLHVIPGYGHLDPFLGQRAHVDVFPSILEELAA